MTLVGLYILRGYIWTKFSVDFAFFKKIIVYSLPLMPFTLIGYFSSGYIDAIFVSRFLSISDLGVYSVAVQMSGILMQPPTLANSLLIPLFITLEKENRSDKIKRYFSDVLPTMTLFWSLLCSLAAFVGYHTLQPVFGGQFAHAIIPIVDTGIGGGCFFSGTGGIFGAFTRALRHVYRDVRGNIFCRHEYNPQLFTDPAVRDARAAPGLPCLPIR